MPRRKQPPVLPDPNQLPPGTPYIRYLRDSGGTAQEKSIPEQQSEIIREPGEAAMLRAPFARVLCGRTP